MKNEDTQGPANNIPVNYYGKLSRTLGSKDTDNFSYLFQVLGSLFCLQVGKPVKSLHLSLTL